MIFASCRRSSILLLSLCAFFLAACEPLPPGAVNIQAIGPAKTNEEAFGPNATSEEISRHFSGTSFPFNSQQTELYFGSDGRIRGFASRGGGYFSVGKWRVDGSSGTDLLHTEQTVYRAIDGNVTSDELESSYRVYIRGDFMNKNSVSLDLIEDGRFEGVTGFLEYVGKGFLREDEFSSIRKNVLEGVLTEESEPSAGALIGEGAILLLLCAGSAMILCPI